MFPYCKNGSVPARRRRNLMPLEHNFRVDTVSALTLVAFLDAESQNLNQIASHCAMSPVIFGFRGSKLCTSMFAVWSGKVAFCK